MRVYFSSRSGLITGAFQVALIFQAENCRNHLLQCWLPLLYNSSQDTPVPYEADTHTPQSQPWHLCWVPWTQWCRVKARCREVRCQEHGAVGNSAALCSLSRTLHKRTVQLYADRCLAGRKYLLVEAWWRVHKAI